MGHSRKTTAVLAIAALLGSIGSAAALDPSATDPRVIMKAVRDGQQITRSMSRIRMSIQDPTGKRERVFSTRVKRYEGAYKTLLFIEQPADLHDTGFLTIDYSTPARNDEQWIYLPKLHRVSRLGDSGKTDSFVGSDFSISDLAIAGSDVDDFDLKLLESSVRIGDDDCWLIESHPRTAAVRSQTGYGRSHLWVSKSKLFVIQFKGWVADGKKVKYFKANDMRNPQGVWTAYRAQMRTLLGNSVVSETLLEVLSVNHDAEEVVDSDFTVQRLGQGV